MLINPDCRSSLGEHNNESKMREFMNMKFRIQREQVGTLWNRSGPPYFQATGLRDNKYESGKQSHGDGSRTFGLWARRIAKKESIVFGNFNLVLVESFGVEPSISRITEMLEDFCLVVWLDRVPLHVVRARARRARPSAFLVLKAKESTRGRLEAARE